MLHVNVNLNTKYLRYNDTQWYNNKIILRSSLYLITTTNQRYSVQLLSIINNASLRKINKIYPTETSSSPQKNLESFLDQHPPIRKGAKYPRSRWSWREGDSSDPYRRLSRQVTAMIQDAFPSLEETH